jgi:hypothetical protein
MSAVNRPNLNFDNEKQTHVPYREVASGSFKSKYEEFMRPKRATTVKKEKRKKESNVSSDAKTFRQWFK